MIVRHDRPVIIGSGVGGLSVALAAGPAIIATKTRLGAGSSDWAQGGVASALGEDDHPDLHAQDTLSVSAGLAVADAVEVLTRGGPDAVAELIRLGARFDRTTSGDLALGREGGHGRRRIVHANGDATGAEIMRTLTEAVDNRTDLEVHEDHFAVDLVLDRSGSVVGVVMLTSRNETEVWLAPAVVIATGGIGQVYARTTNPTVVTGDGIAMAARAGAVLADMEFVQFHPTALDARLDPMPLLTEALRGEGAHLIDGSGHRYMLDLHPDAELAPRDVVARANYRHRGDAYLDATMIGAAFPERFPTVFASAMAAGLDPRYQPLPVSPACHYFMGGIDAAPDGATSLPGLFAVGEAASTGIHGANRLASNSLLEGLVFGRLTADAVRRHRTSIDDGSLLVPHDALDTRDRRGVGLDPLRSAMWEHVGVERSAESLRAGLQQIDALTDQARASGEGRNLHEVARLIATAALERRESRGAHYRLDHPTPDPRAQERRTTKLRPALGRLPQLTR